MMKVYQSGPINSKTPDGADHLAHKARFTDLQGWLRVHYGNWEVVNPIEVGTACVDPKCGPFDGHSWNCWLKADLKEMLGCDAIVLLPHWDFSAGALLERNVALAVGMREFHAVQVEMEGWLIRG